MVRVTELPGKIRDFAFILGENGIPHWLLLFPDRVNTVEGLADDPESGRLPNILGEMGLMAEVKHDAIGLGGKALAVGDAVGLSYKLRQRRRHRPW